MTFQSESPGKKGPDHVAGDEWKIDSVEVKIITFVIKPS